MEMFNLESFPTSESANKMLSYVSDGFYDNSYVGRWLFQAMGIEYDAALEIVSDLPYQFFPETATWGLTYHEIKWGLPVRENLSYEERRRLICQKRDYRAPITPYRMEKYLNDATGFKVRIADAEDPGEYGYVAQHPNVFKAYFLGEGTLNVQTVRTMLNDLKQSHTSYTINDRTEIELDCRTLEEIRLRKIIFSMATPFWDCYVLNGDWLLDGSVILNARRRYNLVLGFKYFMGDFYTPQSAGLPTILFSAQLNTSEDMSVETEIRIGADFFSLSMWKGLQAAIKNAAVGFYNLNVFKAAITTRYVQHTASTARAKAIVSLHTDFWRTLYLNGEITLDGRKTFRYNRGWLKAALTSCFDVRVNEEYGNAVCITKTRDYWFLDGNIKFDGSRNLNSIYRKESVE